MPIDEPITLDKQPTEQVPAVQKSATMNTLIVEQVKDIAGLIVFLSRIVTIRNLVITVLIFTLFNVVLSIYQLVALSLLFGRLIH